MAAPYVNFAPAEIGPCTATWFIGTDTGGDNDLPTFGPATLSNPVGAWDYLVDGPLKDVLTAQYASVDAFMEAWAQAGGEVSVLGRVNSNATPVLGIAVIPLLATAPFVPSKPAFAIDSVGGQPTPYRWVVKFSVPHSIIK